MASDEKKVFSASDLCDLIKTSIEALIKEHKVGDAKALPPQRKPYGMLLTAVKDMAEGSHEIQLGAIGYIESSLKRPYQGSVLFNALLPAYENLNTTEKLDSLKSFYTWFKDAAYSKHKGDSHAEITNGFNDKGVFLNKYELTKENLTEFKNTIEGRIEVLEDRLADETAKADAKAERDANPPKGYMAGFASMFGKTSTGQEEEEKETSILNLGRAASQNAF